MTLQFVFDPNRCTGCQSCQVACNLEFNISPLRSFRSVHSFNENHRPGIPTFSLSMACNHCDEAPCMKHCPALAFNRDSLTGAILHKQDACIGCRYCTWACPFDAPKYNHELGVIQKCTFCNDKLSVGLEPSCVQACPVDALNVENRHDRVECPLPGIPDWTVKPALRCITPRHKDFNELENHSGFQKSSYQKITPSEEWPLMLFTLILPFTVAWMALNLISNQHITLSLFVAVCGTAGLLSTLHLGRKKRAYRAILNLRHSWLSREIAGYSLFFCLSSFSLYIEHMPLKVMAILIGVFTLLAIDRVYAVTGKQFPTMLHSSSALLNGFYFTCIGLYRPVLVLPFLVMKTGLIWSRIHADETLYPKWKEILKLLGPMLMIGAWSVQVISFMGMAVGIGIIECIDRYDFYNEIDTQTPQAHMASFLKNMVTSQRKYF